MQLTVTLFEFLQDGRETVHERLPGFSTQLDSAVLRGESALFERQHYGANGFIIHDREGVEVARWKAGEPKIA